MLLLDLDRFKVVNDSLGHNAGDRLLIELAPRLRDAVRPGDTIGRLGGDEFAVICEGIGGARAAIEIAERLQVAVQHPVLIGARQHFLHASIGIALDDDARSRPDELLRDADVAMYRAKDLGRGRVELFDEPLRRRVVARMQIESELRVAVTRGEIEPYYQPVIDIATGAIVALEALARWQHPTRGVLLPTDFISIAEDSELVTAIGTHMLTRACHDVARWQRTLPGRDALQVCVNVSARQIADRDFASHVADIAHGSGLSSGTLALEITETVLLEEANHPTTVLTELHAHNLRVLLDDFGTGYSSMSYLNRFQMDGLKIDRSFVQNIANSDRDLAIIRAIINMANAVAMLTVAEGVEEVSQLERLRELGCVRAQGHLFFAAASAEETESVLRTQLRADET